MANTGKKFSRRTIAFFWTLLVAVIVAVLIRIEQISILYVLVTLSLVILLLTVGFADLEKVSLDGSDEST
ncbi:MAG: hypothetical protein KA956_02135 [Pyrinomonadaceae bacterium]|nr:hypothetical protein [Acidobacteriota bacterium]MBP7375256.1 hypothetical protein [Pyrinomonadaceae bacterium]